MGLENEVVGYQCIQCVEVALFDGCDHLAYDRLVRSH